MRGQTLPPAKWRAGGDADLILSRIIWLDGLEPGINKGGTVDSRARYIYLHGTNQEQLLGTPASHGCVRMANRDIAALFLLARARPLYINIV